MVSMSVTPAIPNERDREFARMLLEQQESDRGCVIFGAAHLEDDLEALLRAHCLKDANAVKKVVDPLFHVYAPFSTFSAKIHVSYALGLIEEQLHTTLDLIRRLRNDFAHERKAVSFQTPKYQSQLREILNTSQPEFAKDKTIPMPDDDEQVPGMGKLTKREFVDRLAFCLCVARTSARILVSLDYHVNPMGISSFLSVWPKQQSKSQRKP
jgi:DNA-binding MltR family transcriptional regulator